MSKSLEQVIYESWEECGRKKSEIARDMGMPLATLSRKVAAHDDGAKLAVSELIPFMRATGDAAILDYLADSMGLRLVSKQSAPNGKDLDEEIVQAHEAVAIFLIDSRRPEVPDSVVQAERREAAKELDDVLDRRQAKTAPFGHVYRVGKVRPDKVLLSEGGGEERQ